MELFNKSEAYKVKGEIYKIVKYQTKLASSKNIESSSIYRQK